MSTSRSTALLRTIKHAHIRRTSCRSGSGRGFFSLPDISKLAGLVSNASGSSSSGGGVETDGEIQKYHARKILPYSQKQLYGLVSDVPAYSSFIPFCTSSKIISSSPASPSSASSASSSSSASSASSPSASSSASSSSTPAPVLASATASAASAASATPWISDTDEFNLDAELIVGFGGMEERYVSKVTGKPHESVTAVATRQSHLFKSLKTTWSFAPASPLSPHPTSAPPPNSSSLPDSQLPNALPSSSSAAATAAAGNSPTSPAGSAGSAGSAGPTLLTIDLAFAFVNPLHRIASQAVLPTVAEKMVEAFEKRCVAVYGQGKV